MSISEESAGVPALEPTLPNKYQRVVSHFDANGVQTLFIIDVYDVLVAYKVTCPCLAHAVKKLLMPGSRGHKSFVQDLEEAKQAIDRAIQLSRVQGASVTLGMYRKSLVCCHAHY